MNNNNNDNREHVVNVHVTLKETDMSYFHEQYCICITERQIISLFSTGATKAKYVVLTLVANFFSDV